MRSSFAILPPFPYHLLVVLLSQGSPCIYSTAVPWPTAAASRLHAVNEGRPW